MRNKKNKTENTTIDQLKREIRKLEAIIEKLQNTPDECAQGAWCRYCAWGKGTGLIANGFPIYICEYNKCRHFASVEKTGEHWKDRRHT